MAYEPFINVPTVKRYWDDMVETLCFFGEEASFCFFLLQALATSKAGRSPGGRAKLNNTLEHDIFMRPCPDFASDYKPSVFILRMGSAGGRKAATLTLKSKDLNKPPELSKATSRDQIPYSKWIFPRFVDH